MTNLETLLKRTINMIDNKNDYDSVDWDSTTAKAFKIIYDGYEIGKSDNINTCPMCDNMTNLVLQEKSTKKTMSNYCSHCVILFK